MKNHTLVLAPILAGILLAIGCSRSSDSSGSSTPGSATKQLEVAVIPKGATHPFWKSVRAGAEAAGKEFNCRIQWNSPERENDRERQIQIIEDFIARKV